MSLCESDCIKMTQELVNLPSESSNQTKTDPKHPEKLIVEYLAATCHKNKIKHETQEALPGRNNFIAHFPSSQKEAKTILITGHMDTVSATTITHPFSATIKDNKIWGRGACDDKGPIAAALTSLITLRRENLLKYNVTFAATVDEECSMTGAAKLKKKVQNWDLCIGLEPTGLKLIKAHKGVYRCKIITRGHAAHSSTPENGNNAIIAMYNIMTDLQTLEFKIKRYNDKELGRASLAITQIEGGTSPNIIPDYCSINIDVRLLPGMEPETITQSITNLLGNRGEIDVVFSAKGLSTDSDLPVIQEFQNAIGDCGYPSDPETVSYATDCSQLTEIGPCIVWGPGYINQAHQLDEHIEISQLNGACQILQKFLSINP